MRSRLIRISLLIIFVFLQGCRIQLPGDQGSEAVNNQPPTQPLVAPSETIVTFQVDVPANSPISEGVYLSLLDEVTGLALNAQNQPMQILESPPEAPYRTYVISLPFAINSVLKYRYERQSGSIRVAEHTSDDTPVRYRLYYVQGQGTAHDVVSRWTDTGFESLTGRVQGKATDATSGLPIPNLLISTGGIQTITTADGTFLVEGLPAGIHNLVAYAMDGSYSTFQQEAQIATESTTPTPLKLSPTPLVTVVFVTSVPSNTPPTVPIRLAGNLYQLGNSFGSLKGGISSLASNMPTLKLLPDGRYSIAISLPIGADIRYKYTLGDGFWNAEHTTEGKFRLRQAIIPDHNVIIEDSIETWSEGADRSLSFDVTIPEDTPDEDYIAIQFNPLIGWTEPIPMWRLGPNRWAYILYSPLNLPGNFSYRYCRNGQCGFADDVETPGLYGAGRPITIDTKPKIQTDQIDAWVNWLPLSGIDTSIIPPIGAREQGFWTGVELVPFFHPSWKSLLPKTVENIQQLGANWVIVNPSWTFGRNRPGNNPPTLAPIPGSDPLWFDTADQVHLIRGNGMNIAIHPITNFLVDPNEWWQNAPRDLSWWTVWFDQYRSFILHYAELSARTGVSALILGNEWIDPALPDGRLGNGEPSGAPEDVETWWRNLITEVRQRYSGPLIWELSDQEIAAPPSFMDAIDQIYIVWTSSGDGTNPYELGDQFAYWLDTTVRSFQAPFDLPVILGISVTADPDTTAQLDTYSLILEEINQRQWIGGVVTRGYFPPVGLTDKTTSVNGKPTASLLSYWFPKLLGIPLP